MKKRFQFFGVLCTLVLIQPVSAQSQFDALNALIGQGDTAMVAAFLNQWQKQDPGSADLVAGKFNVLVWKSMEQTLAMSDRPIGDNCVTMTPQNGQSDSIIGFLCPTIIYKDPMISQAMAIMDAGIAQYPDRLDLRFGKVYVLGEMQAFDAFAAAVAATVDYGATHQHKWLWTNNQVVPDPQSVILQSVQDYQVQLFDTEVDSLGEEIALIANTVLKYYPDNIENLSNLAIGYMLEGKIKEALQPLLAAEKLNPSDAIVLSNIAWCYAESGDKQNAIIYYQRVQQVGDAATKQYAGEEIERLKNN